MCVAQEGEKLVELLDRLASALGKALAGDIVIDEVLLEIRRRLPE